MEKAKSLLSFGNETDLFDHLSSLDRQAKMHLLLVFQVAVLQFGAWRAEAAAVFAHFMVSNSHAYTTADWTSEIQLAQAAHIDAFALNIAYAEGDDQSIANAFQVASSLGFRLFFSFDYAGNGPW